jgi:hypothetical protein
MDLPKNEVWPARTEIVFQKWHQPVRAAWRKYTGLTETHNKERIGLLSAVMLCIMARESGGDPQAAGPKAEGCQTEGDYYKNDLGLFQLTGTPFIDDVRGQGIAGVETSNTMRCNANNNILMAVGLATHYCNSRGSIGKAMFLWPDTSVSSADCRVYLGAHYWQELGLPGSSQLTDWESITCKP